MSVGTDAAPGDHYDGRTIALHWIVAGLVLAQWLCGKTIDWWPKGPLKIDARTVHILFGATLAIVLAYRIGWRALHGRKFPDGAGRRGLDGMLSSIVHVALYATLVVLVGLGLYLEGLRGDSIFGLFHVPQLGNYAKEARHLLANRVTDWHALAANTILILAGLHAAAGIAHHVFRHDGVLRRMVPRWVFGTAD